MVLAMSRPSKHPKTGIYYFRKVVPEALRPKVGKREIKFSLKTKDPAEARRKHAAAALRVEADLKRHRHSASDQTAPFVEELDTGTIKRIDEAYYAMLLDEDEETRLEGFSEAPRQTIALSGEKLAEINAVIASHGFRPPNFEEYAESRQEADAAVRHQFARGNTDIFFEAEVDEVLSWDIFDITLSPQSPSRKRIARELQAATIRAEEVLRRRDQGEPVETPSFPVASTKPVTQAAKLTDILAGWWRESETVGLSPKTYESYSATVNRLIAFLKHEDAARITPEDLVRYKDHRLGEINPRTKKPVSAKTVKDSDLAGLKAVFNWAIVNRKMTSNPAQGITIKLGKKVKTRSPAFSDEEAKLILNHALSLQPTDGSHKAHFAKRWVPWLCAYTGARVGEMVQLRKQDIRKQDNPWTLTITPEAGTVKDKEARTVPLHVHLVEQGFPEFVEQAGPGYLFFDIDKNGRWEKRAKTLANRLRDFVREVVTDKNVQPNHGWRHRFKTLCREAQIDRRIMDEIQGHASSSVSDDYGDVTIKAMALALEKFPRQGN